MTSEQAAIDNPFVGSQSGPGAPGHEAPPDRSSLGALLLSPLVLAALALILSFCDNPLAKALTIPLMVWTASPIAMRAWWAWRCWRRLNIDFLDALAVVVSIAVGDLLAGAMVVFLVTLGEAIRDQTAARSRHAVRGLGGFETGNAWILRDGAVEACPASKLAVGDVVVVHPGEVIPVDGEVVGREATVDQRPLTGESAPILLAAGDPAWAATSVVEGQLRLRAIRTGLETAAAQVARLVETAPLGDTRIQNYAERFADCLVIPTLALAVAAGYFTGDHRYLLSVLVVDFGTGVRVAAPIAVLSSMIQAARAGIVFKSGSQIEQLGAVDTVIFDKTGTLTADAPEVGDVISYDSRFSGADLIALSAAVETQSRHPIAAAIRAKAKSLKLNIPGCDLVDYAIGRGVVGRVGQFQVRLGNDRFMQESGVDLDACLAERTRLEAPGGSQLFIAIDEKLAGVASVSDQIRAESVAIVRQLRDLGIREIVLLSGDNEHAARSVASQLGVDRYFANASPSEKVEVVQELQREGRVVAMIGDGMNDSPALSYANVGIAVKHGAELAHESAGVLLADDSLAGLVRAIKIARGSLERIHWGYAIVAVWNFQALLLALTGLMVSPAATALVSDGSAIFAGLYGMGPLLRRQGESPAKIRKRASKSSLPPGHSAQDR
jgi:heavy metal translocating P-type ATPase